MISGFTHYLLIVPSGFVLGVFLGELEKVLQNPQLTRQNLKLSLLTFAIIIIVASSFLQVTGSLKAGNTYINRRRQFAENYISPIAKTILKYASADESMAIWGWASQLHVETGIVQATRDGATVWHMIPHNPQQPYFMNRYIDDLLKSNPKLFIDTVARGQFYSDRNTEGHEAFPEIANVVNQNYKLVDEVQEVRIYLRKGT